MCAIKQYVKQSATDFNIIGKEMIRYKMCAEFANLPVLLFQTNIRICKWEPIIERYESPVGMRRNVYFYFFTTNFS